MKKYVLVAFFVSLNKFVHAQDTLQAYSDFLTAENNYKNSEFTVASSKFLEAANQFDGYNYHDRALSCQNNALECLIMMGSVDDAIKQKEANQTYTRNHALFNTLEEADLYNQIGKLSLSQGRIDLALENFKKAIQIIENLKVAYPHKAALYYNNLGIAYWNSGNNELALEILRKALDLRIKIYGGEDFPEVAATYNNLGLVYSTTDINKALEYYQLTMYTYQNIYPENHPSLGIAHNNIAIAQKQKKNYSVALKEFDKALSIWQTLFGENHPNVAFVYSNIGQVYVETGEYEQALEFQNKALSIYQNIYGEKHPDIANIYNQIGLSYNRQSLYAEALSFFQKAINSNMVVYQSDDVLDIPPIEQYYNPDLLLVSILFKAKTLEAKFNNKTLKLRELETSFQLLNQADKLLSKIRQVRTNQNDKIALGSLSSEVYEDAIRICLQLADVSVRKKYYREKAFQFSEKSKSAVLLEAITDAKAKNFSGIPEQLAEDERALKADISYLEQKLALKPEAVIEKEYRNQLFELNRKYQDFIKNLEVQYPNYYQLKYEEKDLLVADLQTQLNKEKVIVSYFLSEQSKKIQIFKISNKSFKIFEVDQINSFDEYITGLRNSLYYEKEDLYIKTASALCRQLLPMGLLNSKTKEIVFIPFGKLAKIPFEVLLTQKMDAKNTMSFKDMPYLVKKYAIEYQYAASLVMNNNVLDPINDLNICMIAPINFENHPDQPSNLYATEDEVAEIKKSFENNNFKTQSFLFENAQENNIKSIPLKNFKIIHFATHGQVNETNPELSQIVLLSDTSKSDDGSLYSGEIFNLSLDAELVTLSACQTGLGKLFKGEGMMGLTRALIYAGAKNMLVSLWKVSDSSTAQLMIDFYNQVIVQSNQSSVSFSKALQIAKKNIISSDDYANPYFWAPFVLIGNR